MNKKHKKVCTTYKNYIKHLFILAFTITECASISALASLVGFLVCIVISAAGIKICVMTTGMKRYQSINKKKKKKAW